MPIVSSAFKLGLKGMEGILTKKYADDMQALYPVWHECLPDVPTIRFKTRPGRLLVQEDGMLHIFSEEGRLDIAKVLRRITREGIHPSIKGLVWEFLLGCYDHASTFKEQNQIRQRRRHQYNAWKTECQNMVHVIGSGKFITTAIVTDDGQPLLQSSNSDLQEWGWNVNSAISDKTCK